MVTGGSVNKVGIGWPGTGERWVAAHGCYHVGWFGFRWILWQNCRSVLPWHTVAQLASAQKETLWMAGGDELCDEGLCTGGGTENGS